MRILIVTAGSRGDVAPFTGLGLRLQQAGHHVALAAHDRFADLVRECGLEHRALPGDPVELVRARTAAPSPQAAQSVFAGRMLHRLGVAPHPLPLPLLTTDTLTDALRSCLDRPTYRDRATELARRIRADDGAAVVLSLITQLAGERGQCS